MENSIIGIDGGKSGAIAVAKNGTIEIYKMPADSKSMRILFEKIMDKDSLVFLEKVNAFIGENDLKKYAIIKMLNQVQTIKTTMEQMDVTYIEVASVTWQSKLGLRFKGKDKPYRKQKYFEFAKRYVHQNKVAKYQGDAVCILAYGIKEMKNINPRENQSELF